ncbi:MAG: bifunctional riboflavin kinase/FAD synthetase [Cyanobacteria bacterium P01_F01_bin.153]
MTSSLSTVLKPTAIALGNFDGVHRGHAQVIRPVLDAAARSKAASSLSFGAPVGSSSNSPVDSIAAETLRPTVVSFYPHPQVVLRGASRSVLTPTDEKAQYLQGLGVEQLVLLPFNRALQQLTPEEFLEKILLDQLQARMIAVGEDFRFGRGRAGSAIALQELAAKFGVPVIIASMAAAAGDRISSSRIRECLELGEVRTVHQLLDRPYSLTGRVVKGQQLGRTIGFPTANIQVEAEKLLPRFGVYSICAHLESGEKLGGVVNIGCRPTVAGEAPTVEAHLFDWNGDLYGQMLTIKLKGFIRPEQPFESLDALKAQIAKDCEVARDQVTITCC